MNLVDSSGWLEYLGGGPRAGSFSAALEDTEQLLVPTICVTEVCKVLQRDKGEEAAMMTHEALLWTTDAHFKGHHGVRYFSK